MAQRRDVYRVLVRKPKPLQKRSLGKLKRKLDNCIEIQYMQIAGKVNWNQPAYGHAS
jgi:hypothetical protein